MKPFTFLIASSVIILSGITGCAQRGNWTRPGKTIVVQSSGAVVRQYMPSGKGGDSIGVFRAGDTIAPVASRSGKEFEGLGVWYGEYVVSLGNDSGLVTYPEVKEEWQMETGFFTIPVNQDKDAWARANYYVSRYATMKIQVSTEFQVETYNPIKADKDRGFSISRLPQGDQVRYEVKASGKDAFEYLQRAAYYIRTGKQ